MCFRQYGRKGSEGRKTERERRETKQGKKDRYQYHKWEKKRQNERKVHIQIIFSFTVKTMLKKLHLLPNPHLEQTQRSGTELRLTLTRNEAGNILVTNWPVQIADTQMTDAPLPCHNAVFMKTVWEFLVWRWLLKFSYFFNFKLLLLSTSPHKTQWGLSSAFGSTLV